MTPQLWAKPFKYFKQVKLFLISLCVIISLVVATLFIYLYNRTDDLMVQRVREQAVNYADIITHIKMWNFDYGGVYVEKKEGVESNSYLKQLGINPDVKAEGGKTFTVRNHAIMIEEISRRIERQDGVTFHITSLKPLDPRNAPDVSEQRALTSFNEGVKNLSWIEQSRGTSPVFRYLLPLYVDQSCLQCHSTQGYKVGNVIGAISVTIPIGKELREANTNKLLIILAAVIMVGALIGITYFLTWRLVIKLDETQRRLKKQATTDELTGFKNRRHIMKRLEEEYLRASRLNEPLCLIFLDLDHFKQVNDTYGHPFGDIVLKNVAARIRESVRGYDIVGRIGGEEFMIIAPGSSIEEATVLAERVRNKIAFEPTGDENTVIPISISAGVTIADKRDNGITSLLKRADNALYRAKQEGRNRVAALIYQ